ncbi:MAG: hypothetical protein RRY11_12580 [Terrisporobacter sp.]
MTRKVIRTIVLGLSLAIIALTLYTISIGFTLALISQSNSNTETWKINNEGCIAANNVYESNQNFRNELYNSPNAYTRWISTSNDLVQIVVGFTLLFLSFFSSYIWLTYLNSKIKKLKRKLAKNRKRKDLSRS